MTYDGAEIWIFYGCDNKLLGTCIETILFQDDKARTAFFFAKLYGCVHTLLQAQIRTPPLMMESHPHMLTVKCCGGHHFFLSSHCYYCEEKK